MEITALGLIGLLLVIIGGAATGIGFLLPLLIAALFGTSAGPGTPR